MSIPPYNKHLLSAYCVPGTWLDAKSAYEEHKAFVLEKSGNELMISLSLNTEPGEVVMSYTAAPWDPCGVFLDVPITSVPVSSNFSKPGKQKQ